MPIPLWLWDSDSASTRPFRIVDRCVELETFLTCRVAKAAGKFAPHSALGSARPSCHQLSSPSPSACANSPNAESCAHHQPIGPSRHQEYAPTCRDGSLHDSVLSVGVRPLEAGGGSRCQVPTRCVPLSRYRLTLIISNLAFPTSSQWLPSHLRASTAGSGCPNGWSPEITHTHLRPAAAPSVHEGDGSLWGCPGRYELSMEGHVSTRTRASSGTFSRTYLLADLQSTSLRRTQKAMQLTTFAASNAQSAPFAIQPLSAQPTEASVATIPGNSIT